MRKNLSIKVYTPLGSFVKEWTKFVFNGYTKEINAGLGECTIELLEKFDYAGGELALGNTVIITVADKDTFSNNYGSRVIYSGYISLYEPHVNGSQESITVHLLGHYTKLSSDILKNSTQTTMYTDSTGTNGLKTASGATAADTGNIIKAILARYAAETSNPKLCALQVPVTGQYLNYIFNQKTYREALDIALGACPSGYFYYIDERGGFTLKTQAQTPAHIFILDKHITSVQVERSMEKIKNVVLIWNGLAGGSAIYKSYSDATSIVSYGRRVKTFDDPSIQDVGSMANVANKFITEHKDPDIKVTCKVIDNNLNPYGTSGPEFGYDIENIEPGETCRFMGFNESFANIFRDNMLITKVEYHLDYAILTIENIKTDLVDQTKQTQDQVNVLATKGVPDIYT